MNSIYFSYNVAYTEINLGLVNDLSKMSPFYAFLVWFAIEVHSQSDLYRHPKENFKCVKCPLGNYVKEYCIEDLGYSTCEPCGADEYVGNGGATSCAKCTVCSETHKKFVWRNCSKGEDTMCYCGPNETFEFRTYCVRCIAPKVVYRSESDVDGKCVYCKATTFYNTKEKTCKPCTKCGSSGYQSPCNATHDSVCFSTTFQTTPSSITTRKPVEENGLDGDEIAGIVIGILIVILVILICRKTKGWLRKKLESCLRNVDCLKKEDVKVHDQDPLKDVVAESDTGNNSPSKSPETDNNSHSKSMPNEEELTPLMSSTDEERNTGTRNRPPSVQINNSNNNDICLAQSALEESVAETPQANQEIMQQPIELGEVSLDKQKDLERNDLDEKIRKSIYTANEDNNRTLCPRVSTPNDRPTVEVDSNLDDAVNEPCSVQGSDAEQSIRSTGSDAEQSIRSIGSDKSNR